jgi:hypothetical protein
VIGNWRDDAVGRVEGGGGEGAQVAFGVDDHEPPAPASLDGPVQQTRVPSLGAEHSEIGGRGNPIDPVLAGFDHTLEVSGGPSRSQVASRLNLRDPKHAVDDALVVGREDQDREVFVEGAQIDRQIGRDRRLAHAPFVGDHCQHRNRFGTD